MVEPLQQPSAPPAASLWLTAGVPALFVLLWSTGFIAARLGLPEAEPFTFLLLRFLAVSTILAVAALIFRMPWPRSIAECRRLAVAGILIHGCYLGGVFKAISLGMPASVAALIVGLQPLLTAALASRYLGEQVRGHQWLGLVLGFLGVVLVVREKLSLSAADAWGVSATAVALLGITFGTLYQKRHMGAMNLVTGSSVQFAAVALVYLPIALLFENGRVTWSSDFVIALSWLTLVLSIGAISLFYLMIRRGAAAKVASLFYLVPSVTALMAFGLFGETLNALAIAGMALAAVGVALVSRG